MTIFSRDDLREKRVVWKLTHKFELDRANDFKCLEKHWNRDDKMNSRKHVEHKLYFYFSSYLSQREEMESLLTQKNFDFIEENVVLSIKIEFERKR